MKDIKFFHTNIDDYKIRKTPEQNLLFMVIEQALFDLEYVTKRPFELEYTMGTGSCPQTLINTIYRGTVAINLSLEDVLSAIYYIFFAKDPKPNLFNHLQYLFDDFDEIDFFYNKITKKALNYINNNKELTQLYDNFKEKIES